jgi:hypothetical protein
MPTHGGGGGSAVVSLSLYIGVTPAGTRQRHRPEMPFAFALILALAGLAALTGRFAAAAEETPVLAAAASAPAASVPTAAAATAGAAAAESTATKPLTGPDPAPAPALVRVSSSFDAKHAAAVLRQVGKLFGAGFVRKDAEQVAAEIDALPAEQSRVWEFNAVQKGKAYALRVRARLDEFGDVDLDFFSAPEIASAVRSAVDRYLNARGL